MCFCDKILDLHTEPRLDLINRGYPRDRLDDTLSRSDTESIEITAIFQSLIPWNVLFMAMINRDPSKLPEETLTIEALLYH